MISEERDNQRASVASVAAVTPPPAAAADIKFHYGEKFGGCSPHFLQQQQQQQTQFNLESDILYV